MKTQKPIFFLFILISSFASYAQYNVFYKPEELESFKKNKVYVLLGDVDAPASKPYINMIKQTWPNSNIEFINRIETTKHMNSQSLFLSITTNTTTTTTRPPAGQGGGLTWDNTYFFFRLWKYSTDKKGNTIQSPIIQYSIFTDFDSIKDPYLIFESDYSKGGHIRNWSVGIVKNYIQSILAILDGKGVKLSDYRDKAELDKLKTETLYIPDYTFINFNKWTGDETKRFEVTHIMKDYDLPYKILSPEELSTKILDSQNPIYYLLYVKNSTTKYISVINSQTGKIVYAYGDMEGNYNIKPSDLKDLAKAIKK